LACGITDVELLATIPRADKAGIDCPFAWPQAFVDVVSAHRAGRLLPPADSGRPWRRELTMRATDLDVQRRTGLTPLSVSADRIGHAALRWAAIAAALAQLGVDTRRDGNGPLIEVYPAAALKLWGLRFRGYKKGPNRAVREELVDALMQTSPWLDLGAHERLCRVSDDALDSVLCALVARAAAVDGPSTPHDAAAAEGWIHLPEGSLDTLVS
jgi:predicted nuclease with RNAse H fold